MSGATYINRHELANMLKESPAKHKVTIIDVRDDDYHGGHIKGAKNVPSSTLDHKMPELVRTLMDEDVVVFHCMLSQQRGPTAAKRYHFERERAQQKGELPLGNEGEDASKKSQHVYILNGGFVKWQEDYGKDVDLTEDYLPEIWASEIH